VVAKKIINGMWLRVEQVPFQMAIGQAESSLLGVAENLEPLTKVMK